MRFSCRFSCQVSTVVRPKIHAVFMRLSCGLRKYSCSIHVAGAKIHAVFMSVGRKFMQFMCDKEASMHCFGQDPRSLHADPGNSCSIHVGHTRFHAVFMSLAPKNHADNSCWGLGRGAGGPESIKLSIAMQVSFFFSSACDLGIDTRYDGFACRFWITLKPCWGGFKWSLVDLGGVLKEVSVSLAP